MLRVFASFLLAAAVAQGQSCRTISLDAADGVVASPANHRVLLETEDVRVLEVSSAPHTAEKLHTHADPAVMITDGFSTGSLIVEGQPPVMHGPPPDNKPRVVYLPSQGLHHAENLGDTPFHAIRIELKHPGCSLSGRPALALDATDAVVAAPQNYKVLIENADVRVLEVTIAAHTSEPMHSDIWPSVLYVYKDSRIRISTPAQIGAAVDPPSNLKPVPRLLPSEGLHSVENLGDTTLHGIRVELKLAGPDAGSPKP